MNLFGARQTAGPEQQERMCADGCEQNAEQTAGDCEDGAFGEALAYQASAAGAEGDTHGQFAITRDGTREHQAGDVDTGNQQYQTDGAQQQPESGLDVADQVLTEGGGDEGVA